MSEITKKALATSLKKLLSKKELSKITISNITNDCGVNRQTFYYHFKDVYDLLEWIYLNEVIQSMDGKDTYDTWQQGFLSIFEYLLMNIIEEKSKKLNVKEEDKEFIANFYKYGFVGIVQDWIESGMKENPNNIIDKLNSIIDGNFENALENLDKIYKM